MKNFLEPVKNGTKKTLFKIKVKSPELLMIFGAATIVTGTVLACKATTKLNDTIKKNTEKLEADKKELGDASDKSNPEHKKYVTVVAKDYAKTGIDIIGLYAPSALVITTGFIAVFASNDILRKRCAEVTAAAATINAAFKNYRKNVVEAYGEEVDRNMRFGIKSETAEFTEKTKSGKEKSVTKNVDVVGELGEYSEFARFFDEGCSEWTKDPEYNLTYLKAREYEANLRLRAQGHLFLNEVYDMLGIPRTKAGQVVGWIYDLDAPNGDNEVNFGIYNFHKEKNRDFVNGYEPVILLDFNVDGVIVDKI